MRMCGGLLRDLPGVGGGKCHAGQAAQSGRVWLVILLSLAGAVAPRAEARARVGFGPGGLAARWRSFVRVAGRRRTPSARRPGLAREGGLLARHRGQRACSLESSCPSLFVSSFVSYATRPAVGPSWRTNCALSPAASGRRVHRGVLTRMARSLTLARWGTDGAVGALTNSCAAGY